MGLQAFCEPSILRSPHKEHKENMPFDNISVAHNVDGSQQCGDWRTHQVGHPEWYSTCSHCPSPRSATIALQQCQATTLQAKLAIKHFCNLVEGNARLESLPSLPVPVSLAPAMHHQLEPHNKICDCVHLIRAGACFPRWFQVGKNC